MRGKLGFLKNFAVNITATGAAAVLIVWLIAVVAICIWGNPTNSGPAYVLLSFFGGLLFVALGQKLR
jgi:hypothetical protein